MNPTNLAPIVDTARRVARTVVQVALAFGTVAAIYPLIVTAIGAPAGSNVALWLATIGTWVATISGIISRIMAIPAVNGFLAPLGLTGHSGAKAPQFVEPPTATTLVKLQQVNGGEFTGTPAH